ncbi:AI-2E family transporter [Coraliomargarita sinensis]|uniref:AI-2E family transporter n=1 Tax=Coraliomargarita sinensis TaxID=2174842 RepID=A0A317ZJ94_9BACT|nr:AI-2E family transporter [Coraliomargarita sinensis]PXA05620.1 AI-2E family transporter [Coraliomargarita sinensis]
MNLQRAAFAMIIVILSFYVLYIGQNLLLPLVIAGAIAYLISILAHGISMIKVRGIGVPKALSMLIAVGVILLGIGFIINLITVNIASVIREAPAYQDNLESLIYKGYTAVGVEEVPNLQEVIDQIDLGAYLQNFGRTVRSLVSSTGIIIVYLIFLLLEQRTFADKIKAIIQNRSKQKDAFELIDKMRHDIRLYVAIKVLTSATTGLLSFGVLHFVGVDFASFWAVLIFLLNFIPTIGSIIATAFPSMLTLIQFDTLGPFIITISILSAIQFCIGSLVEPKLMGNRLNLSPIVILLSLGLWGSIWGIPGMFLCVPITVIMMIVCSYFPNTRPVAVLLSGNGKVAHGIPQDVAQR